MSPLQLLCMTRIFFGWHPYFRTVKKSRDSHYVIKYQLSLFSSFLSWSSFNCPKSRLKFVYVLMSSSNRYVILHLNILKVEYQFLYVLFISLISQVWNCTMDCSPIHVKLWISHEFEEISRYGSTQKHVSHVHCVHVNGIPIGKEGCKSLFRIFSQ